MKTARGVYLAGPSGFTEPGRRWHFEVVRPAIAAAGFEALDPWSEGAAIFAATPDPAAANRAVAARNAELIRRSAGVLAVLDGSDVDSGTAAEIGYAAALSIPVVGLRTDIRRSGDNEYTTVNLQVEFFLAALCTDLDEAIDELHQLLAPG